MVATMVWLSPALLHLATAALPPFTQELAEDLWKKAEQNAAGLDYENNEAFVCGAGNWGDGPQCDQWDQGRSPCWPSAMTVSASWDVELMARWSIELAEEFGLANRGQLGPGVNLARFPWNGRLGEYQAGEDPYFGAEMVRAMVTAYRTVDHPPLQTVKHFIPNTIETDRQGMTETVDERTLFEVYYPPFVAAIEAGVSGVMCSYNLVKCTSGMCSGEAAYACANDDVLNKHLKDAIGFKGIVISDWDATKCNDESIPSGGCSAEGDYIDNDYAADGGLDLEMPSCITFKGGVTKRAKEKAARMQWAYLVQGRSADEAAGRRLQEKNVSSRRLQEGFCCWWPLPDDANMCNACTKKADLSDGYCPEDRTCGGASAQAAPKLVAAQPAAAQPAAPAAAAAAPAAPGAVARTKAEQPELPGWVIELGGGRCLEVGDAGAVNGASLIAKDCDPESARQQFTWESSESKVRWAAHPAMCLDIMEHLFEEGTKVQIWECLEDDDDQIFDISVAQLEEGALRPHEHPRFCLESVGAGLALALCKEGHAKQRFLAGKPRPPSAWASAALPASQQPAAASASLRATTTIAPETSAPTPEPATPAPEPPSDGPAPSWHTGVYKENPFGTAKPTQPPAPADGAAGDDAPAPSWHTGVYKENPFGTAKSVPAPPPPSALDQGPGCPDEGGDNYKSECKLALADRIIAESSVILKNDGGVLPLAKGAKVALVGTEACAKDPLAQGGGSGWNGFACNEVPKVNVKDGIAEIAGVEPSCPAGDGADNSEAASADVVVAVVAPAKASEGTDRSTLQLEGEDVELIKKYGGAGKKLVVVINAPGPMITSTWDSVADAVLITWLPGQQNGKGIAAALYAEGNEASGRLPFTFPKCSTDECSRDDEFASVALGDKIANKEYRTFSEKALIGYRWYHAQNIEVSYPFGFGLFAYGSAEVSYKKADASVEDNQVTVTAELSQSGTREGKDVPQLYLSFPESVPGDAESKPEWVLKGFTKVSLKPNEPKTVSFVLHLRDLSYWDDSPGMSEWVCAKGEFKACVGANARDAVTDKAACTRFTPRCPTRVEVMAKDELPAAGKLVSPTFTMRYGVAALAAAFLSAVAVTGTLACKRLRSSNKKGFAALTGHPGEVVPEREHVEAQELL